MSKKEKLRKAIKEYFERMIKSHITREGSTTDRHIDCPKCGKPGTIFWSGGRQGYWNKCWSCGFELPKELTPPGPEELEEVLETKDKERRRNAILQTIKAFGITI